MEKTIDFDELMNCVSYVGTPVGDCYLLRYGGIRKRFKDTGEVVPFMKEKGYTVLLNGEAM